MRKILIALLFLCGCASGTSNQVDVTFSPPVWESSLFRIQQGNGVTEIRVEIEGEIPVVLVGQTIRQRAQFTLIVYPEISRGLLCINAWPWGPWCWELPMVVGDGEETT